MQLPGRADEPSQRPFTRIDDIMTALFPQVMGLLDRPIAIYGHSMGALVAFELTRELRRHGYAMPVALFVSGRRAPHKPLRNILLYNLPEPALVVQLRKLGGDASIFLNNARWRRHYLPTIRADLQLSDVYTYRDERPLECPLYAFVGEADDLMHREDWEAWSEQAGAEFCRWLLPGGHIFDRGAQAQLIAKIADILTAKLTRGVPAAGRGTTANAVAGAQAGA